MPGGEYDPRLMEDGRLRPRVLFVNQYFWPDVAATAQLLADLTEDLVAAGLSVGVVAGRGSYEGRRGTRLAARESWRGAHVRRVRCSSFGRSSRVGRIADYASFMISSAVAVVTGPRCDVIVCLSTPPFVSLLGVLAKMRGSRFVYKAEDVYPDLALALGFLRSGGVLVRLLGSLARWAMSKAEVVVVLDDGMDEVISRSGAQRVEVIPNWSDGAAIQPDPSAGLAFRARLGLEEPFVVLYSGNFGLAHRFDAVAAAARDLEKQDAGVHFLFVGGGARLPELRAGVEGLKNCTFLGYQPREDLRALYAAADLHLVTLRDEVANLLWPSKYPAALAAGKPVLFVGSESMGIYREVEQYGVGWSCRHQPGEIVDSIKEARGCARQRGVEARRLFEGKYTRDQAAGRWHELLSGLLSG